MQNVKSKKFKQWLNWQEQNYNYLLDIVNEKTLDLFSDINLKSNSLDFMDLSGAIHCTESPIEQLMYLALVNEIKPLTDRIPIRLYTQTEIETEVKKYRADFMIAAYIDGILNTLIVECDGHDFHEKTKTQAKKDKQRDRALISSGFRVMHFTGSEIYADAVKCAEESIKFLLGNDTWSFIVDRDLIFQGDVTTTNYKHWIDIPNTDVKIYKG